MPEVDNVTQTIGALKSASALTEGTFLKIGQTLEASIGILSKLTSNFETVLVELKGENLASSTQALAGAATKIAAFSSGQPTASTQFDHLQRVAGVIAGRITKMNGSVKSVNSLAINSRIAAAAIPASDTDFTTFADEIGRTMALTRTTLDSFGGELQTLRKDVTLAYNAQLAFEKRQTEATRSVLTRLNAMVASVPKQHKRAAQAISAVWQRSERIREQICSAVVALQAGDTARQRIEHAELALGFLSPNRQEGANAGDLPMTGEERQAFRRVTCRLQSAQLSDAGEQFERDIRQITTALSALAAEARTLRTLAGSAYGSSGQNQGTFIVELETQVGEAVALFTDLGRSQAEAARVMASVSLAADSLCNYLRTVQSLEADIRIMGLNTTLKCARVGPEGRPLGLIAQELRTYGNDFAKEADALMGEVETLAAISRSMGSREVASSELIDSVMQTMKEALSTLQQVGRSLGETLSVLEQDSDHVVLLLDETAASLGAHDEIGRALRQASSDMQAMSPPGDLPLGALTSRTEKLLEAMERSYTMASERAIHNRVLGRSNAAAIADPVESKTELEDMLF